MKEFTPARADQTIGFLEDERRRLLDLESESYVYFEDADGEERNPGYSYVRTRERIADIDRKTAALRHALNLFEASSMLPASGITVDEGRIRLGLMEQERRRLAALRDIPSRRCVHTGLLFEGPKVEYECANFDVERANRDYVKLCEDISSLQLEIGRVSQTETFVVEL